MTRALLRLQSATLAEFIFKNNGQGSYVSQDPSVVLPSIFRGWAQRAWSPRPLEGAVFSISVAGQELVPWPEMASDLTGF